MSAGDYVGFVAGALVTFSLVPQTVRVFRLKSAREISLVFTTMLLLGILMWLAYGVYFRLVPVVVWNVIGAILVATLMYAKLKFGKQDR